MSVSSSNGALYHLETWKSRLGLFPMPLFEDKHESEKFILLNGGASGDFCLDFNEPEDYDLIRSYAWSSDVGHYMVLSNEEIQLYRWDTFRPEKYKANSVSKKLEDFYSYVRNQSINRQDSIVKFGISLYRNIRSVLRDGKGNNSLGVLLYLLAHHSNGYKQAKEKGSLILPEGAKDNFHSLRQGDQELLIDYLSSGLQAKSLRPNIDLLLRHAAGSIFQEAQFEILFPIEYQTSFEGFLPPSTKPSNRNREQTSAHYTPTSIVRTIVEEVLKDFLPTSYSMLTVFDPACGSGEFLKEFLRQIRMKNYRGKIRVIGWDISQTAIDMAAFILAYETRQYNSTVELEIVRKDALISSENWKQSVDFVLMNPPFISWELMHESQKEGVTNILGDLADGRPNSAGAFLLNAYKSLNDKGKIGCILPMSILEADSFKKLRSSLHESLTIEVIGRLGSHSLFADAIVDAAIFIAEKKKVDVNIQSPVVLWSDHRIESSSTVLRELRKIRSNQALPTVSESGYSIYTKNNLVAENNWAPIEVKSYELLSRLQSYPKVRDLFDVKQGVRTGMNSVFIIEKEYLMTLDKKEKKYFRPAVTNESIQNGKLIDKFYIFYAEGKQKINTEKELKAAVPKYYKEYLQPNKEKLAGRARKDMSNYWKLSEHRAWQVTPKAKIISTEFGKAGAFAYDKTGIYVAERSNAWFPKGNKELGDIGYAYIAILSLPIINQLLQGISKQIGGGQWYLASKFINDMPIPDLFSGSFPKQLLDELISVGILIDSGEKVDQEGLNKFSKLLYHG